MFSHLNEISAPERAFEGDGLKRPLTEKRSEKLKDRQMRKHYHGGYGETVITRACGACITGSIPVSRPSKRPFLREGFFVLG